MNSHHSAGGRLPSVFAGGAPPLRWNGFGYFANRRLVRAELANGVAQPVELVRRAAGVVVGVVAAGGRMGPGFFVELAGEDPGAGWQPSEMEGGAPSPGLTADKTSTADKTNHGGWRVPTRVPTGLATGRGPGGWGPAGWLGGVGRWGVGDFVKKNTKFARPAVDPLIGVL